jgi:hypothetical protein
MRKLDDKPDRLFFLLFSGKIFFMEETVTLSTVIDARVKNAVVAFCRRRGIKMRHLIEQALIEQLEDEIDLEAYYARRGEETVALEEILAGIDKRKR